MFALVRWDAKKISTQQSLQRRHLLIASIHSLGLWIPAFESFQEVPPSALAVSAPARRLSPCTPTPDFSLALLDAQAAPWNVHPTSKLCPVSLAHSHVSRETGKRTAAFCHRNDMALPSLPWLGYPLPLMVENMFTQTLAVLHGHSCCSYLLEFDLVFARTAPAACPTPAPLPNWLMVSTHHHCLEMLPVLAGPSLPLYPHHLKWGHQGCTSCVLSVHSVC